MIESGKDPQEIFAHLKSSVSQDVYRDTQHLDSLNHRIDELKHLWNELSGSLQEQNIFLESQYVGMKLQRLCSVLAKGESDQFNCHWLYFACFTTVKEYYLPVLKLLAAKKNVSLWFTQPPKSSYGGNPLANLVKEISSTNLSDATTDVDMLASHRMQQNYERGQRVVFSADNVFSRILWCS